MFKFDLLEDEKIIRLYRQSESVLFKPAIIILILIYLPWYFLLRYQLDTSYAKLLLLWTVLVLLYGLNKYLLWLLNSYLITDKRVILIYYSNLFSKKVLETPWDRILNVGFTVQGVWQSLFNFGSVEIQTAGLHQPLCMNKVSEPSAIKDFLWQIHHQKISRGEPANFVKKPGVIQ